MLVAGRGLLLTAVEGSLQGGLFGQMLQQLGGLFLQMDVLVDGFHSGGERRVGV